ncbi:MAG TPA: hypothetical protein VEK35_06595 [Roseiarcus sp.]|nr:hypothetical protein [Roseiarcus sp.]
MSGQVAALEIVVAMLVSWLARERPVLAPFGVDGFAFAAVFLAVAACVCAWEVVLFKPSKADDSVPARA